MTHRATEQPPNKILNLVVTLGAFINAVVDLLPAPVAARVHRGRKSVVATAGSAATLLAAFDVIPLPAVVAPWVAGVLVVLTGVSAWAVPNAK